MSATQPHDESVPGSDPLIDEVRAIRREISDQFGNDVDRLCDHLREVERQYVSRTGSFADLAGLSADRVTAGWPDEVSGLTDPLIDEVRRVRGRGGQDG